MKNDDIELFKDLINERVVNDGNTTKKSNKKLVDIELQYEQENDKTLLQVAVDEGKEAALKVRTLTNPKHIFRCRKLTCIQPI